MEHIKDFFVNIFSSRIRVTIGAFIVFAAVLIGRLYYLQIVNGAEYQDNYTLKLEKTETIPAIRGNIYDRKGNLLAYNELVYAVTIADSGTYSSQKARSEALNQEIADVITKLEKNGDSVDNDFPIYIDSAGQFQFYYTGTNLQRFRADVFNRNTTDDLIFNEKLGFDEALATPDQIMEYLEGASVYNVSDKLSKKLRYEVAVVRYNMGQKSYQKYLTTTIASDVSDKSVAYIKENINELTGVDIEEKSLRKYIDSEYFAHIIGYTGQISTAEYLEKIKDDETVETIDVIGKSGIEKYMDNYLCGTKGYETLYVDSVGNTIAVGDYVDSTAGNDVYLSIDKDLQKAAYILLEQEIAGILYSKLANIREYHSSDSSSASDVVVPIYDVYYSLISNQIIDINAFSYEHATPTEKAVQAAFNTKLNTVLNELRSQLNINNTVIYGDLSKEYQSYSTYLVTKLKSIGVFDSSAIDSSTEEQNNWTSEKMAVNDYLVFAIENNWIDITKYEKEAKYADTEELYDDLVNYIIEYLSTDKNFQKLVYKYLILEDGISGNQLALILFDQGVIQMNEEEYQKLSNGYSSYEFFREKIRNLELTPGQLALDPCSGSTVMIDSKTGEVLACVTYPGYDNNKLANSVDADYYAYLTNSNANPLYNYATQQRTAPGSTFKIVSSTAGLSEDVITTTSEITDLGQYEKVSNKPKCWIYPSNHGSINVSEAIRDSCNYFFYEVGFRLAGGGSDNYNDETGIEKITEYASLYGLGDTTGIEIEENAPHIATEYPVMAAIGQSDNNYTTIGLARYVTAISNKGTVYDLTLLDSVKDSDGNEIETFRPTIKNQVDVLDSSEWNAIHSGMRMVVESLSSFKSFSVDVAGKTGTAQQVVTRPNHALFIGFAPYDNPEIAIATRIAYGYTSHNAADVSKNILAYYFGVSATEELLNGEANTVTDSENEFTD